MITYPDKDETLNLLLRWEATHADVSALFDDLETVFGRVTDSRMYDVPWETFGAYTAALGKLTGAGEWLEWYWAENGMGTKGLAAGFKLEPIRSRNDLWRLIAESRERDASHG